MGPWVGGRDLVVYLGVEKRVVAREVSVFRVGIEGLCLLETK